MSELRGIELVKAEQLTNLQKESLGLPIDSSGLVAIETRCSTPTTIGRLLEGGYSQYLQELIKQAQSEPSVR